MGISQRFFRDNQGCQNLEKLPHPTLETAPIAYKKKTTLIVGIPKNLGKIPAAGGMGIAAEYTPLEITSRSCNNKCKHLIFQALLLLY